MGAQLRSRIVEAGTRRKSRRSSLESLQLLSCDWLERVSLSQDSFGGMAFRPAAPALSSANGFWGVDTASLHAQHK